MRKILPASASRRPAPTWLAVLLLVPATTPATELVYRPLNPSFGGSPLLSGHYLGLAAAQKKPERSSRDFDTGLTESEQFVRQLQSRLLSSLATQVNDAIFGDNPQQAGTIVFGDQTISFERGLEFIRIDVVNATTGEQTSIQVPVLQVSGGP